MERLQAFDAVALPDGARLAEADREILEAVVGAVAGLRHATRHPWREAVERLEREGWTVTCRVGFIAEARRPGAHETAAATTKAGAIEELRNLTLMDAVEGCP